MVWLIINKQYNLYAVLSGRLVWSLIEQTIICKIFDIWLLHLVLRISWVRIFWDQQREGIGRIGEATLNKMQNTFNLSFLGFVDILLVVCDNSLWQSLTDSINLGDITSTSDSDSDVEVLESFESEKEDGFKDLDSEGLGFEQFDGWSIDSKHSLSWSNCSYGHGVFLSAEALGELLFGLGHMAQINYINILINY